MANQRARWVLNASVALKWHFPQEPYALQALELLSDWSEGFVEFVAPDIFFAEIAHALVRAVRRARLSSTEVGTVLQDLLALPIHLQPSHLLVPRALEIALAYQQSAYDCLYVALAEREGVELWTGDEKLVNALGAHLSFALSATMCRDASDIGVARVL